VDGAIYTMKYYAKIGRHGGWNDVEGRCRGFAVEEQRICGAALSDATKGAAVFINAFNFPAWGLCEKAAPALLSGVPS